MNKGDNESGRNRKERRLKWYGYVMQREEDYIGRRTMEMEVQGRRKTKTQSTLGLLPGITV